MASGKETTSTGPSAWTHAAEEPFCEDAQPGRGATSQVECLHRGLSGAHDHLPAAVDGGCHGGQLDATVGSRGRENGSVVHTDEIRVLGRGPRARRLMATSKGCPHPGAFDPASVCSGDVEHNARRPASH